MDQIYNDDTFLARWLNNELNEEELQSFQKSEDYQALKRIAGTAAKLNLPDYDSAKALASIQARIREEKQEEQPVKVRSFRILKYAAAASVLLLSWFLFHYYNSTTNYTTLAGMQQTIQLPDDSEVVLNASSQVWFKERKWENNRTVRLKGEAFFKVRKGATFQVETDNGTVEVLGTSFNVYTRDQLFDVSCFTGKVAVVPENEQTTYQLTKGEKVVLKNGEGKKQPFNSDARESWRTGLSTYESAALSRVIKDLENQFDIKIHSGTIDIEKQFTGPFVHRDLETALQMVFEPMGITYRLEGKKVLLL